MPNVAFRPQRGRNRPASCRGAFEGGPKCLTLPSEAHKKRGGRLRTGHREAHKKRGGRLRTGHREAATGQPAAEASDRPLEVLGRVLLGLANCCILRLWKCLKGSARLGQLLHPAVSQAPPRLGFGYRPGSADIDRRTSIKSLSKPGNEADSHPSALLEWLAPKRPVECRKMFLVDRIWCRESMILDSKIHCILAWPVSPPNVVRYPLISNLPGLILLPQGL